VPGEEHTTDLLDCAGLCAVKPSRIDRLGDGPLREVEDGPGGPPQAEQAGGRLGRDLILGAQADEAGDEDLERVAEFCATTPTAVGFQCRLVRVNAVTMRRISWSVRGMRQLLAGR